MAIPITIELPNIRADGSFFSPADVAWVLLKRDGMVVSSGIGPTTQFFDNPPDKLSHTYTVTVMDNAGNEVSYPASAGAPVSMNEAVIDVKSSAPIAPNG